MLSTTGTAGVVAVVVVEETVAVVVQVLLLLLLHRSSRPGAGTESTEQILEREEISL